MSIERAFATVSGLTLVSRVLGFIRDIMIAAMIGAGPIMDVFLLAFKLPNMFRRLFAEGALSAAFVPIFANVAATEGRNEARNFAGSILYILTFALLLLTIIVEIAMPWIMPLLAPGFSDSPEMFSQAVEMTRITFPYLLLISIVALLSGIGNSMGRYGAGAFAPILLNLSLIAFLLAGEYFQNYGYALSWGVFVAGIAQLIWMALRIKAMHLMPNLSIKASHPKVKEFFKKFAPGMLGAGVVQINLWIDVMLATFLTNAVGYLYFADRMTQLPLALIGTAMGTVILPKITRAVVDGSNQDAIDQLNRSLVVSMFFALPAAIGLMIASDLIIHVLFEHGKFTRESTNAVAVAMIAYSAGLPAFVAIKILATYFFANGNTTSPVKIAGLCLGINISLNLALLYLFIVMGWMPHVALATATSVAAWANVLLLLAFLRNHYNYRFNHNAKLRLGQIMCCISIMAIVLFAFHDYAGEILIEQGDYWHKLTYLLALIAMSMIIYFGLAVGIKIFPHGYLLRFIKRSGKKDLT